MEAGSKKEKLAAGLLALLLGVLGFHKFYLGYKKQGIIVVCISVIAGVFTMGIATGVMFLVSIVEGIVYLSKSEEEFQQCYVQDNRYWF